MRTSLTTLITLLLLPLTTIAQPATLPAPSPAPSTTPSTPQLAGSIPLPVTGRIDHLAIDPTGKRLFIAAFDNSTVEVLDLAANKHARSLKVFHKPQGVAWLDDLGILAVACGEGQVLFFDRDLNHLSTLKNLDDADNLRYDSEARRLYVGYANGILGTIDPQARKNLSGIQLSAHPESFQLEKQGPRIFVNVPQKRKLLVIDRTTQRIAATWSTGDFKANFPMALDESSQRLFIACRGPAKLLAINTQQGNISASADCVGDADDICLDAPAHTLYVIGGEGFITPFHFTPDQLQPLEKIPTSPGARTGILDPTTRRLYIALPRHDPQPAELRIYQLPAQ